MASAPPTTTSPAVALLSAAALAAAAIAYWSSASNTTALGTIVLEILRSTGTIGEGKKKKKSNGTSKNKEEEEQKREEAYFGEVFVSWLEREEEEAIDESPSRNRQKPRASRRKRTKNNASHSCGDLNDPLWMSEMVRDALLSTAMAAVSIAVDNSAPILPTPIPSGYDDDSLLLSRLIDDEKETLSETAFRRSFRSLQTTTEAVVERDPRIREDFFGGVQVERDGTGDNDTRTRPRSLSDTSSSTWSATSSSMGFYGDSPDDYLVEDEREVERLLTYLRFVESARDEASPVAAVCLGGTKTKTHPKRREGYEIVRCATTRLLLGEVTDNNGTDRPTARVGHVAAVHRGRKELLIALHCDGSTTIPADSDGDDCDCDDGQNRIKNLLANTLVLQQQQQQHCPNKHKRSSLLLEDGAIGSLSREILLRYLPNRPREENTESSFLSSGYTLVLCGHSMGAALACRLGEALRQEQHRQPNQLHTTGVEPSSATTHNPAVPVRVYAFGTPPCFSSRRGRDSNRDRDCSYITSVVNNHDCVPRWTESNLLGLRSVLRGTMERKKKHFQKYFGYQSSAYRYRYNRHRDQNPYRNGSATEGKPPMPPPRIPSFSLSSGDWNTLWKSGREQTACDPDEPRCIVPGKVVCIWNHSRDPTIIGAKVHNRHNNDPHDDVLGRLWVEESMFRDHTIEAYRSNLELLLGQVANTI